MAKTPRYYSLTTPYVPGVSAGIVPSTGLPGRTDGSASPSGSFGQIISSTTISQTNTSVANTLVDITGAALPLTLGNWLVIFSGPCRIRNLTGGSQGVSGKIVMTDASNNIINGAVCYSSYASMPVNSDWTNQQSFAIPLTVTIPQTYKLRMECSVSTAVGQMLINSGTQAFDTTDCIPQFFAIRQP